MIIVLFGQPGSGKSTIANKLLKTYKSAHHIDGDKLRELFVNKDYSREGRIKNLNRASDIAAYLNSLGEDVIISMVYPYEEARSYLNSLIKNVNWIYLNYIEDRGKSSYYVGDFDNPYNESVLELNTSNLTVEECINEIGVYMYIYK